MFKNSEKIKIVVPEGFGITEMSDEEFMESGARHSTYIGRAIMHKGADSAEKIKTAVKELKIEDLLLQNKEDK